MSNNEKANFSSDGIHRYRRFKGWDYSRGASLFITIGVEKKRSIFGTVRGDKVELSELGKKASEALDGIPKLNPGITIFGRIIMPDHIHFNCAIKPGLEEPLKLLGNAIRRFKNYITAEAKRNPNGRTAFGRPPSPDGRTALSQPPCPDGRTAFSRPPSPDGRTAFGQPQPLKIWQQGYHDLLLVSREMIDATERYIAYNPLKWSVMYDSPTTLRIHEPLSSPRLNIEDYWKGVGNISLLSIEEKLVSLRVSREVSTTADIAAIVRKMESAVDKKFIIISGFISKGERAVRDMLCRRKDARFIRILPSSLPNRRFKPESIYVAPFAEKRYLEIARGNDDTEFNRRACLDLNDEISEIAVTGEGLALYFKADGLHILAKNHHNNRPV